MAAAAEFQRPDGAVIAYERSPASRKGAPGVVFLHGLRSDRGGTKAEGLARHCGEKGYAFLRFDMFGHGASSGRFEDGGISRWVDDAVAVLEELTDGPQVLVGSSMGGWVMVKTAMACPNKICGLVGLAVAPDFTEDLMWSRFSPAQRETLTAKGVLDLPSAYDEGPTRISRHLVEDGRRNLVLRRNIPIACPVRLIHGQRDADVPWETSMRLAERIESDDVEVVLVKDGDHRLSRPGDLARLYGILDSVIALGGLSDA